MKKIFKSLSAIVIGSVLLIGCENYDFGDTGVDTNNPVNPITSSLLTGAQKSLDIKLSTLTGTLLEVLVVLMEVLIFTIK